MKEKHLTYKEFMSLAEEYYFAGGATFYKRFRNEKQFNDYVRLFGQITEKVAIDMFVSAEF